MDKWHGKIAVVTGGSSGMGAATVKEFIKAGITAIIIDRDEPENKEFYYKCDISSLDSIKQTFKQIEDKFSFIHILVNCAGVFYESNAIDSSDEVTEKINKTINVNFSGSVHCTREGIKLMNKSNDYGYIVNICSVLGHGIPFGQPFSIYPATKYAIRAFSETVRQELIVAGNMKIRVTNISPGTTKTNIVRGEDAEKTFGKVFLSNEIYLDPKNIAESILYLLSTPYTVNVTELTIKPTGENF